MFAPRRTVAPASLPVELPEAKLHLRVDEADEDPLITALIGAAVSYLEGWEGVLGRVLVTQTWAQDFAGFCGTMRLPVGPVDEVTAVAYIDQNGDSQTVAATEWQVVRDASGAYVAPRPGKSWPATGEALAAVTITYTAGQPAATVPAAIKAAILLIVGALYENRGTGAGGQPFMIPPAAMHLLAPFRRGGLS